MCSSAGLKGIRIMGSMIFRYLILQGANGKLSILLPFALLSAMEHLTALLKMIGCSVWTLCGSAEYRCLLMNASRTPEQLRYIFENLINDLFINPTEGRITILIQLMYLLAQKICLLVLISCLLRLKALRLFCRSLLKGRKLV